MGHENSGKRVHMVNKNFFRKWGPNMAYILGFTCADGCIYKRTLSWELSNKFVSDKLLLQGFNEELNSDYPIEEKYKSYRLRINSFSLVDDLAKFGIVSNKTKVLKFPKIPDNLLRHFIRGFFDGDGWVSMRNKRKSNEINVGFVCGSKSFMEKLVGHLRRNTCIKHFNSRIRQKLTLKGYISNYYQIDFYGRDAYNLIKYLFDDLTDNDLFLARKYEKQIIARGLFEESQKRIKFGKKWFRIEKERDICIHNELVRMFSKENNLPKEISLKLGVSLATIYRWLEKVSLRIPVEKGSLEWKKRIFGGIHGKSSSV